MVICCGAVLAKRGYAGLACFEGGVDEAVGQKFAKVCGKRLRGRAWEGEGSYA